MFDYLTNQSFVDSVLEKGSIPFVVRGSLTCTVPCDFSGYLGIRISGPTYYLKVIGENAEKDAGGEVLVNELREETVFPGEIAVKEKSLDGVAKALNALEKWADFLCLATGNPKVDIEVQLPVEAVIGVKREIDAASLDRWAELIVAYSKLEATEKKRIGSALWWYRKACSASYYSVFDGYTAYWNCLEILCSVSGSKIKNGAEVDARIGAYLKGKKVKAGHILECYNRFVNYSIAQQMKDSLISLIGEKQAVQVIYQCFEIQPDADRLYQIRNDINHGNIRENSPRDRERVYLRGLLLFNVVMLLLHQMLGHPISLGEDINTLASSLSNPPWREANSDSK